jgi:hypothetical protein
MTGCTPSIRKHSAEEAQVAVDIGGRGARPPDQPGQLSHPRRCS